MITIPLANVIAYLQCKGVDLACLEGAPLVQMHPTTGRPYLPSGSCVPVGQDIPLTQCLERMFVGPIHLVIGRDIVCPAAMGWAAAVLAAPFVTPRPCVLEDAFNDNGGSVCLWGVAGRLHARWTWTPGAAAGRAFGEVLMSGPRPATPAARLQAVLLHELSQ